MTLQYSVLQSVESLIWVGFPRMGIWLFRVTFDKLCWTAVAKPYLLHH